MKRNWQTPNLRKLFKPDFGNYICDVDLDRADAQVVAWDAGAEKLKEIFKQHFRLVKEGKEGIDLHQLNADAIGCSRPQAKAGVHATNYFAQARTLGIAMGISTAEAQDFIDAWFAAHPEIPKWHKRIEAQLAVNRTVQNAYGYKCQFFGRTSQSLPEALAWIPQSTVAITINKGWMNLEKNEPDVEVLMQVHDSLVFQYPIKLDSDRFRLRLRSHMLVEIPYPDPLVIPVGLKRSQQSWGDCKDTPWETVSEVA